MLEVGVGEIDLIPGDGVAPRQLGGQRLPDLSACAEDHRAARRHRLHVGERRMVAVGFGELGVLERDRPVDVDLGIGQVDEDVGVACLCRPVRVDQVGVRRVVGQGLVGVPDPARDEHGGLGTQLQGDRATEAVSFTQVDPGPEDAAGDDPRPACPTAPRARHGSLPLRR